MKNKILYVGAHNDDAEIFTGGTLLIHQKTGYEVVLAIMDHNTLYRKEEQKKSDELSGFRSVYFNSEDELREILLSEEPSIIITHWIDDRHPDHRKVSNQTLSAMKQLKITKGLPKRSYYCSTYDGLGLDKEFHPTHYVDISNVKSDKTELIKQFKSQTPEYWIRKSNIIDALYGSRTKTEYSEGLKEIHYLGKVEPTEDLLY